MYQPCQLDILLYLHQSVNCDTTKNRITYKNKTITVNGKEENANMSKGPATNITDYAFDQCLPINHLRSATFHTERIVTLAVQGYSTTMLLMNSKPSLVARFMQQQVAFLNTYVASQNQKRTSSQSASLKMEYCYISLTDQGCQNILNKLPISNDDIIANGIDRYMADFTTSSEAGSIILASSSVLAPKLMALKITNYKSVCGYLYLLDLQQPYSSDIRPYLLSTNFKSLEKTVNKLILKNTELRQWKPNGVLDHVLMDLLVGRQHGLLMMDVEESPQDDDLPQIEKCLSFVSSVSSVHGFTSKNVDYTWIMDTKLMRYKLENEKLDEKAHALEIENQELKNSTKEVTAALEAMDRQSKALSENWISSVKKLEASISTYKFQAQEMAKRNSILQEKLFDTESMLHTLNTKTDDKYQTIKKLEQEMARQKSLLQEKVANIMSSNRKLYEKDQTIKELETLSVGKTAQIESTLMDRHKQEMEGMERSYKGRMQAMSTHHMEARNQWQEQLTRSKDKSTFLEKEVANLKKQIQNNRALENSLKKYHDQWQEAQKTVSLHQATIQQLHYTNDQTNRANDKQQHILQQEISDGKAKLQEMEQQHYNTYHRLQQEHEIYVENNQRKMEDQELKLEQQSENLSQLRNDVTEQQNINQTLLIEICGHQQEIQKLQADNSDHQQLIQRLQAENHRHQITIQQLQTDNHGLEQGIQKVQMESRQHQETIQELKQNKESLLEAIQAERKTACENKSLVEQLKATIKQEEIWSQKQLNDMKKERATILQWIGLARLKWNDASVGTNVVAATAKSRTDLPTVLTTIFPGSTLPSTFHNKVPIYVFPLNPHKKT